MDNKRTLRGLLAAVVVIASTFLPGAVRVAGAQTIALQANSVTVWPRKDAVCADTRIDCTSSADCAFPTDCVGNGLDSWLSIGEITSSSPTSAFIREVDRDGATVGVAATAGAWTGDEEVFDGGECSPLGKNADTSNNGVRCKNPAGSVLILRSRTKADGTEYVRMTARVKHQGFVRPNPTSGDTPLIVSVESTSYSSSDGVTPCRVSPNQRITCRE